MPRGTPHVALRLDSRRRAQVEAVTEDRGVSRSDLVRAAIDHYLAAGAPGLGHRPRLPLDLEDGAAA